MPAATPCPGSCNAAWRRAEELGQPHTIQPVPGEPVHCWECYATAHNQLQQLPTLFVSIYLDALHGPISNWYRTLGGGPTEQRWPGQQANLFADGLVDGLLILANDTREHLGDYVEPRYVASVTLQRSVGTLTKNLRWLLGTGIQTADHHPCAGESHGGRSGNPAWQISVWHRSAEVYCKEHEQRPEHRLAPCRRCKGPYLVSRGGLVECRDQDCRAVMTPEEYADYVAAMHKSIQAAA